MHMRMRTISILALAVVLAPKASSAVTLLDTLALISTMLNSSIGILITLCICVFFWGLIRYLTTIGSDQKAHALRMMWQGVLTIFVMVSIWGIVRLLQNTFGVTSTEPVVPQGIRVNVDYYRAY